MAKAKNSNLHRAKDLKRDEFYTQLADIEKEIIHYSTYFNDKVVYCNCDDVQKSNFFVYFRDNFLKLGLKKLITVGYVDTSKNKDSKASYFTFDGVNVEEFTLIGNGDFRNKECIELLKQADIVVTNPPFSLFREYISQLIAYNKKFVIIGSQNAVTYKNIFPLLQNGGMFLGINSGNMEFKVPEHYNKPLSDRVKIINGSGYIKFGNICWLTNLKPLKDKPFLKLTKQYSPKDYRRYDNYDAINVNKLSDIPMDYKGEMGVPITFINKWNREQFEVIKFRKGDDGKDLCVNGVDAYFRIIIKHKTL